MSGSVASLGRCANHVHPHLHISLPSFAPSSPSQSFVSSSIVPSHFLPFVTSRHYPTPFNTLTTPTLRPSPLPSGLSLWIFSYSHTRHLHHDILSIRYIHSIRCANPVALIRYYDSSCARRSAPPKHHFTLHLPPLPPTHLFTSHSTITSSFSRPYCIVLYDIVHRERKSHRYRHQAPIELAVTHR